jgi:alcohol dehydrogenase
MSPESAFDWQPRTRVLFGLGTLQQLGPLARELGMTRVLLVSDPGIVQAGYTELGTTLLTAAGMAVTTFSGFDANPDGAMVAAGAAVAAHRAIDGLVAIGGGSSLDCAKGINFLVTGGGTLADYRGYGRARGPLLPMIGVPTTAGTGSDAQSYAVISDAETQVKMACGDPGAAFRVAILDPDLTRTQPRWIAATAGYDALSHAVEAWVTTRRTPLSELFAREAWRVLNGQIERALLVPRDDDARGAMLLGAHLAGLAVEHSMLGAAHACANPLTTRFGTTHGVAVSLLLPHVVRWNAEAVGARYAELIAEGDRMEPHAGERLATRLESLSRTCDFPVTLAEAGVTDADLPELADAAVAQWTGTFNPRPLTREAALALYHAALA